MFSLSLTIIHSVVVGRSVTKYKTAWYNYIVNMKSFNECKFWKQTKLYSQTIVSYVIPYNSKIIFKGNLISDPTSQDDNLFWKNSTLRRMWLDKKASSNISSHWYKIVISDKSLGLA